MTLDRPRLHLHALPRSQVLTGRSSLPGCCVPPRHFPPALPLLGLVLLLLAGCRSLPPNTVAVHDSSKWTKDIDAFQAGDFTNPPPTGAIVFVGSSSIRLWTNLSSHFRGLPVVNRGFGGSQLADVYHYADRIIFPSRPRQVVIYAGGNDINAGKSAELVFGDFVALARKIRAASPSTRIAFISVAPNPARWAQVEQIKRFNSLTESYCANHRIEFIDVFSLMLGPDGLPKPDIYAEDRLHLNENGYSLWQQAVEPHLAGSGK